MFLLISGLLVWSLVHFIPTLLMQKKEDFIANYGNKKYRIIFSLIVVFSIILMVFGWKGMAPSYIYTPLAVSRHITMLLMLFAWVLFLSSKQQTKIKRFIRHPQLASVLLWSTAHLLANGDSRSLLLFFGLGFWAVIEMFLINKREGEWVKPEPASMKDEVKLAIKIIVIYTVVIFIHKYISGVALIY